MSSLKYRTDIDGLRAVAVLGVVIYHAFPWMIPGGFIGVDIFFVISGYLISGILYKGHKSGNFSFKEFYARRIRRLFPALITMLVITMAYGWVILLPDEFQQLGKHVASGTLFIQNIVFWQESGYFDTTASLKPLLHLWSLAVEEQFYIFFPLLLLLIWKKKWPLAAIMVVLLVVSLVGNLWMSVHAGSADFFLTPYRAWEFLGGSLLAWWHYERGHEEEVPAYREMLSVVGLLFLGLGMAFIHTGDPYPGWRAILPVAGTLLLMEGGAGTNLKGTGAWINRKILSHPAVVWIGLISYPLYLFHWPALSFVHIVKGESPKEGYILAALGVALLLTILTYYFIEKRIRHHKSRWTIPMLVAAFLSLGSIAFLMSCLDTTRFQNDPWLMKLTTAIHNRETFDKKKPFSVMDGYFVYRMGGNGNKTLFLGDSNMMQYQCRIEKLMSGNSGADRGAIFITKYGVPPIPHLINTESPNYKNLPHLVDEQLKLDPKIDRVVLAGRWLIYFEKTTKWKMNGISTSGDRGRDLAIDDLGDSIKHLSQQGKKVILVLTIPTGNVLDPRNMLTRTFVGPRQLSLGVLKKEAFLKENGVLLNKMTSTALKNGAEVIDPVDFLSTNGICIAKDEEGIPIRYDEGHLRTGYVKEHVKYLDQTVQP
jgi:peptidoglycan/LPS O-acetylase OafA/YrhL